MGNKNSYCRLLSAGDNNKGKFCLVYQDKVYTDFIHDKSATVSMYYLPDRNIGFHILDELLYVYSSSGSNDNTNKKEINLPKKIYDKIIEIHKLMEKKKIKSVFVIDELNNYNTFNVTL